MCFLLAPVSANFLGCLYHFVSIVHWRKFSRNRCSICLPLFLGYSSFLVIVMSLKIEETVLLIHSRIFKPVVHMSFEVIFQEQRFLVSSIVSKIFKLSCYGNVSQNRGEGAAYQLQNIQACCSYVFLHFFNIKPHKFLTHKISIVFILFYFLKLYIKKGVVYLYCWLW